jgi:repressor LexA
VAEVAVIGQVAAGFGQKAVELVEEMFRLPRRLVGHGTLFMLRVKGDSMTGAAVTLAEQHPARLKPDRQVRCRTASVPTAWGPG